MKKIILLISLSIVGSLANASDAETGRQMYKCLSQEPVGSYPISVELTQLTNTSYEENEHVPAQVSIKTVRPLWQEVKVVPTVYKGTFLTEDVQLFFESSDKSINLGIYMDELDQAYLKINGGNSIPLTCESFNN